jgi:hypothetical protein
MTSARVATSLILLAGATVALLLFPTGAGLPTPVPRAQSTSIAPVPVLTASRLAALPEARYDAVIAGLLPVRGIAVGDTAFRLRDDTALYAEDRITPIARLAARNFLGEPTVVVPVESSGDWVRVLSPSRQRLPSDGADTAGTLAPAQTTAWLHAGSLTSPTALVDHIVISVRAQTLSIVGTRNRTWAVGVGAPGTRTPTGVTGYLEARYRDAAQGQVEHPVQLTSLHSTAMDEPFGGDDGGLIGIHFQAAAAGAVSHGCIRVAAETLVAVDALPLGTLVTIQE